MTGAVMVFAPLPQLTITIERLDGEPDIHLHPGGQGVWQARMISSLGVPVTLCAAFGGETGRVLAPLIAAEGINLRAVQANSRNGAYIHDRRAGSRMEVARAPGDPLHRHELDELYGTALAEGLRASLCVLSGPAEPRTVDPDVYRRLAVDLGSNGATVVADLSGGFLTSVLAGGVRLVKVSHDELLADGWTGDDSDAGVMRAMRRLRRAGAAAVVVSRADRPALALLDDDPVEIRMPKLEPADPRGAGDAMTAGVAAVLASGGDLRTAVRTGAAAGALNVTRRGLGTGQADAVAGLVERVSLTPVHASVARHNEEED